MTNGFLEFRKIRPLFWSLKNNNYLTFVSASLCKFILFRVNLCAILNESANYVRWENQYQIILYYGMEHIELMISKVMWTHVFCTCYQPYSNTNRLCETVSSALSSPVRYYGASHSQWADECIIFWLLSCVLLWSYTHYFKCSCCSTSNGTNFF